MLHNHFTGCSCQHKERFDQLNKKDCRKSKSSKWDRIYHSKKDFRNSKSSKCEWVDRPKGSCGSQSLRNERKDHLLWLVRKIENCFFANQWEETWSKNR